MMMVSYWVMVTCLFVMIILYWVERRERKKVDSILIALGKKPVKYAKSNADKRKS